MPPLIALLALVCVSASFAGPFRWTTFTSGSNVRDVLATPSGLWLGTSGGLVRFNPSSGEFETLNNTRGLAMNATVGLGADALGWIWIVAPDGRITRLNPQSGQTKVIADLQDEIFEVSSIVMVGEEVFLGANNGIYRFAFYPIVDNYRVSERVRVLGSFPTGIAVQDLIALDGYLYAATVAGLARAPLSSQQFSAPASWTNYTVADGLPANNVFGLGSQGNSILWLTTQSQTAFFDGSAFSAPFPAPQIFRSIVESGDELYAASDNTLYRFEDNSWNSTGAVRQGMASIAEVEIDGESVLAVGFADLAERPGGLSFFDGNTLSSPIAPRGIGGNMVHVVNYDIHGGLWVGTGGNRIGVSRFENESWQTFTRNDTLSGDFWFSSPRSSAADDFGGIWFGSDGGGVLYYRDGEFNRYNSTETEWSDSTGLRLSGIPSAPEYCETRVGRMPTGEILITNLDSRTDRPFAIVSTQWLALGDNVAPWIYPFPELEDIPALANPGLVNEIYGDPFGRFFAGATGTNRGGRYTFVCNPNGTANTADDNWEAYDPIAKQDAATTCFEDINPEVLSFAIDKQNYLWVGTPGGAYYSQGGLSGSIAGMRFICLFDLPIGNRVNHIHVDSQDNKWFATDNGVAVLDPSFTWIHVFQTSSSIDYASDLASNSVTSITSNPRTGEVWIGTLDGLSRLQTPYVSREPKLDTVTPYPNPFRADGSQTLFLDADELGGRFEQLRVFTIGGRLVRELSWSQAISSGWDGKNSEGNFIAGGVYLLVATTADGHSATGKVAVLGR